MINPLTALKKAKKNKYALAHFNVYNLETFQAAVNTSIKTKTPLFIGCSNKTIEYAGLNYLVGLYNSLPKNKLAILHLDHGSLENAKACIKAGFPSVMFDGSNYPYKKNVKLTKSIVRLAHKKGIVVEGELGTLSPEGLTSPIEAKNFALDTGVDSLAVSVGNQHGYYKYMPVLDYKRLKTIIALVDLPIVLHGGSGLISDDIKTAILCGVSKVNIDTELRWIFTEKVHYNLSEHSPSKLNKPSFDPRNYLGAARSAVEEKMIEYVGLFKPV